MEKRLQTRLRRRCAMTKSELRALSKEKNKALSKNEKETIDKKICKNFLSLDVFCDKVFGYIIIKVFA